MMDFCKWWNLVLFQTRGEIVGGLELHGFFFREHRLLIHLSQQCIANFQMGYGGGGGGERASAVGGGRALPSYVTAPLISFCRDLRSNSVKNIGL